MKKSIFVLLASFCIALLFAMNVSINISKNHLKSELVLKNIEALADGEITNQKYVVFRTECFDRYGHVIKGKIRIQCVQPGAEPTCISQGC